MIKNLLKNLFTRKSSQEKLFNKLLAENNCVCFCKQCRSILSEQSELTHIDGIYKETCPKCDYISYFDYCAPAPIHISVEDFQNISL